MGIYEDELQEITVKVRDPDNQLVKLISYIRALANPGHSFSVEVDPDSKENRKRFSMDGDGSFAIQEVMLNKVKVELKDDKIVVKEYLKWIQY